MKNMGVEKERTWKGTEFWTKEIEKAGVKNKLPHFNDVLMGKQAPSDYGEPMVKDVMLDGILCDIYHADKDGGTGERIYIHEK